MNKKFWLITAISACIGLAACMKEYDNPAIGQPSPYISIEVLRQQYKGNDLILTEAAMIGAKTIRGVVISDTAGHNFPGGVFVVQDDSKGKMRGITLVQENNSPVNVSIGDSVIVNIVNTQMVNNRGSLQIVGVKPGNINKLSGGAEVKVSSITLSQLGADFDNFESTLVQFNADIFPEAAPGTKYSGVNGLSDGLDSTISLLTLNTAKFANNSVPVSATFKGIPTIQNESGTQRDSTAAKYIVMRTIQDVQFASGKLYNTFPEDFESPNASEKGSYASKAIDLKTGNWTLNQAILGTTKDRDRFNPAGKQCIRMQQNLSYNTFVQMNFDLPNGASKVTLSYGSYYNDASSSWVLEASTDGGTTWTAVSDTISNASSQAKVATIMLDIQVPVRFRVTKIGLGATNGTTILNGRLSIEDIAIYERIPG